MKGRDTLRVKKVSSSIIQKCMKGWEERNRRTHGKGHCIKDAGHRHSSHGHNMVFCFCALTGYKIKANEEEKQFIEKLPKSSVPNCPSVQ